jgi:hypothetical protein
MGSSDAVTDYPGPYIHGKAALKMVGHSYVGILFTPLSVYGGSSVHLCA